MADENEIKILLTAIDNASKTIDGVTESLGGTSGVRGLSDTADRATESVETLSDAFARMTKEELMQMNTAKLSGSALSEWEKAVHNANQKARDFASTLPKTTLNIGGFTIATTAAVAAGSALAVALGAATSAYIVFGSASEFTNTVLADTSVQTQENIALATEYQGHIDELTGSVNRLTSAVLGGKTQWGAYWTEVANGFFNYIEMIGGSLSGFNFPVLGGPPTVFAPTSGTKDDYVPKPPNPIKTISKIPTVQRRAYGGNFSGWSIVGENQDGSWNNTTELVHAPHGAQVFSNPQARSIARTGMSSLASGGNIMPSNDGFDYDRLARLIKDAVLLVAR